MRDPDPGSRADVPRLVFLFGLAYFAQALGQMGGLLSQPLAYYFKEALGFDSAQLAEYLAVLSLPWMIKPLYGLISDYVPLLGYRRRTWLMLVNLCAATGFLWLSGLTELGTMLIALFLAAFGTAAADVIVDALMVETGNRTGETARFLGVQWFWFKTGAIVTALTGGWLASQFPPATALHVAATLTMLAPIAVAVAAYLLAREDRAAIDVESMRATTRSLVLAVRSPNLRIAAAFLALWCFSPAFGAPLYYHMVDRLHFEQQFIGQLGALTAGGAVIGAWVFARRMADRTLVWRAKFSVTAAAAGMLSYLLLAEPHPYVATVAMPLNVFVGMVAQIGTLTILSVAAQACPPRAEGFVFAALMSLYNGVEQLSAVVGARLYEQAFERSLAPLLWVAAASLLLCFVLIPSLKRLGNGRDARASAPGTERPAV
ncbi:folate/biopterin transporter [Sulfurifustis variabilis]|uniref:Folate/biopterin transporter n=1 Tax=Sulfurifustis variabilis TaxID=1675686 RepID=A0A1C7AFX5_9GAMM|nr:MFS transporter [Sulfurifustis variabilis]BAU50326.1 folate/biopterin transporter [Sulfurifustis variabilis]